MLIVPAHLAYRERCVETSRRIGAVQEEQRATTVARGDCTVIAIVRSADPAA